MSPVTCPKSWESCFISSSGWLEDEGSGNSPCGQPGIANNYDAANRSWTAPECLGFVTECFAFLISGRFIAGLVISTLLCPWAAYHVPVQMQTQKSRAMMAQKCCLGSPSPRQGVFYTAHHSAAVAALPCCVQWFSGVRRGLGGIKHLIAITAKWGGFSKYNKGWY